MPLVEFRLTGKGVLNRELFLKGTVLAYEGLTV
jgi:hypothetical protein